MWHEEYTDTLLVSKHQVVWFGVHKQKHVYKQIQNTKVYQKGAVVQDTKECHLVTYTYIYYINRNNTIWSV